MYKVLVAALSTMSFYSNIYSMEHNLKPSFELSSTNKGACADFFPGVNDGESYWQKRQNYCGEIPDYFATVYNSAAEAIEKAIEERRLSARRLESFRYVRDFRSLRNLFECLNQWAPKNEIPWGSDTTMGVADELDNNIFGKYEWPKYLLMSPISIDNLEDNIELLEECAERLNKISFGENEEFERLFSQLREIEAALQPVKDFEKQKVSNETLIETINKVGEHLGALLSTKTKAIKAKNLAEVFKARKDYLEQNKDALISLLANHYLFTQQGLTRYRDITSHLALDLMPSSFYFGVAPIPQFDSPFKDLKSQLQILPDNTIYKSLKEMIDAYHAIPKMDETRIQERIDSLKAISRKAAELLKEKNTTATTPDVLQNIVVRANLKADYLKKLPALREEAKRRAAGLPQNTGNAVVNTTADMLKDLDPEKRNHKELYAEWSQQVKEDPLTSDYFLWLEGQETATMQKDLRHVFLTLNDKKVTFKDGIAFNNIFREKLSNHVSDGDYVYNISENGDLYILPAFGTLKKIKNERPLLFQMTQYPDNKTLRNELNHDTVMGGINVLCAGIVTFKDGKIIHIDTNSGHYRPLMIQHLMPALAKLLEKHPNSISNNTEIGNYTGNIKMPYEKFLKTEPKDVGEKELVQPTSQEKEEKNLKSLGQNIIDEHSLLLKIKEIEEEIENTNEAIDGVKNEGWLVNPFTGEEFGTQEIASTALAEKLKELMIEKDKLEKKLSK